MLQLWHKPEIKTIYVPIIGSDKPYHELWKDRSYLETIKSWKTNKPIQTEMVQMLIDLRSLADRAETQEELKGINKCIKKAKDLLSIPYRAETSLETMKALENDENEADQFSG